MKKTITLVFIILSSIGRSYSQKAIQIDSVAIEKKIERSLRFDDRNNFQRTHNVRVGWGAYPINEISQYPYYPRLVTTYDGNKYMTGSIFAEYTYQAQKWLEVGANVSYAGYYNNVYDRINDAMVGVDYEHSFALMLTARFNYYNKGIWRLYGQISIGAMINSVQYVHLGYNEPSTKGSYWRPSLHVTLFGVSVGKKYYGFVEFPSIGRLGMVNAGFGIRFNEKTVK